MQHRIFLLEALLNQVTYNYILLLPIVISLSIPSQSSWKQLEFLFLNAAKPDSNSLEEMSPPVNDAH